MNKIREYMEFKKADKIQNKLNSVLPSGVECYIISHGKNSYRETELVIKNSYGPIKELNRNEVDIKELINIIFDACKNFHLSFTFHSHGLDYVYISVEVKK